MQEKLSLPVVEEMILLSRLIKLQAAYPAAEEKKVISIKKLHAVDLSINEQTEFDQAPIEIMEEARRDAEQILLEAMKEKEAIMESLQREKVAWEQEKIVLANMAKEEGYQAGWQEGESSGYKEYQAFILDAKKVIESAKNDYQSYLEAAEKTILDLAIGVANKIVSLKIEENQDYFVSLVKKAIKEVKNLPEVQILVHPNQYDYLLTNKNELVAVFTQDTNLFIYPDSDLAHGSCLIESAHGRIDASIDTQLSEIKKALGECLEGVSI